MSFFGVILWPTGAEVLDKRDNPTSALNQAANKISDADYASGVTYTVVEADSRANAISGLPT